jgi:hypothetical protein
VDRDLALRRQIIAERTRLIAKMQAERNPAEGGAPGGGFGRRPRPSYQVILSCGDHEEHNSLITVDYDADDLSGDGANTDN